MLTLSPSVRVYLASEPVDLRRGHDGLCSWIRTHLKRDPYEGHLFVFIGKRCDRVKVLFWDRGGFVVYYKRLERGRFAIPRIGKDATEIVLDGTSLTMLLDGIDVKTVRRAEHWEPPSRARIAG